MDIKITCQGCGQHLLIDSSAGGKIVPCPSCTAPLTVPEVVSPSAMAPPRVYNQPARKGMSTGAILAIVFVALVGIPLTLLLLFVGIPAFVQGRHEAQKSMANYQAKRAAITNAAAMAPPLISPTDANANRQPALFPNKAPKIQVKDIDRRYFYVQTDPITLESSIESQISHNLAPMVTQCKLQIEHRENSEPVLFFSASYFSRSDYRETHNFNSIVFRIGDKVYRLGEPEKRDGSEIIVLAINTAEEFQAVQALANCNQDLVVRFSGRTDQKDIVLGTSQLTAMKQVLWLWGLLQTES